MVILLQGYCYLVLLTLSRAPGSLGKERGYSMKLKTRYEEMSQPGALDSYNNFVGQDDDYRDWYGVLGRSRDSGPLEESNFEVALAQLGGESEDVRVERYGHWGVGWVEGIYVRPGSQALAVAEEIAKCLEEFPALDDEDFARRHQEEVQRIWARMSDRQRAEHFSAHRQDWVVRGLWDLIGGVVYGEFYGGLPYESTESLVATY